MAGKTMDPRRVRCSFCGKSQSQVNRLIAGPEGIYICDECVEICADIIDEELDGGINEEGDFSEDNLDIKLLKPVEIKAFLDDYVIGQELAKKILLLREDGMQVAIVEKVAKGDPDIAQIKLQSALCEAESRAAKENINIKKKLFDSIEATKKRELG